MSLDPQPSEARVRALYEERTGKPYPALNGITLGSESPVRTKQRGGRPLKAELKRPSDGRRKEHEIQAALFEKIDNPANQLRWPALAMVFAVPNGGHRLPAVAAKLKAEGVRAGVLDVWCPCPRGGFTGFVLEMKRPAGTTTPEQAHWMSALAREGWKVALHTNEDTAFAELLTYLELPR